MEDLKQALADLAASLAELQASMKEVRQMISNEHPNVTLANDILCKKGFMPESERTMEQWGVLDATSADAVRVIIEEVVEYRKDSSLHHCS